MKKMLVCLGWLFIPTLFILLLTNCVKTSHPDGPPRHPIDVRHIPNAKPRPLPRSKYGNPKSYKINGKRYHVLRVAKGYHRRGIASWYGRKFHGHITSSREPYNMYAMTAASPILPLPSFVKVTNLRNHRSVIVKVNDRGPFVGNRILDLSYAAAKKLGYSKKGTAWVDVKVIDTRKPVVKFRERMHHLFARRSNKKFFLQLGAFKHLIHANHLKKRLQLFTKKHVHIKRSHLNHVIIYQVQIGPLLSAVESHQLKIRLQKVGFQTIAYTTLARS